MEAYKKAVLTGKRYNDRTPDDLHTFPSEISDALVVVCTVMGLPKPHERTLRRSYEALGIPLSPQKRGHPRGKKNATARTKSETAATKKSPLTPKEIQTIRDLEWSIPKAQIEREIGKRYERTGSGEYVAVNENGSAAGHTKPTKDKYKVLRRRLKILRRLLSEKPGAPRKSP